MKKIFLMYLILLTCKVNAQQKVDIYHYDISRNGESIGRMKLIHKIMNSNFSILLTSDVKTRLISAVNVTTSDAAYFDNDILLKSKVCSMVNGREKDNKVTQLVGQYYKTYSSKVENNKRIHGHIKHNMISMYLKEPENIRSVYSDNFQQFVNVTKIKPHVYRISLPDGSHNDYYFDNGICNRVIINQSLYTINISLIKLK